MADLGSLPIWLLLASLLFVAGLVMATIWWIVRRRERSAVRSEPASLNQRYGSMAEAMGRPPLTKLDSMLEAAPEPYARAPQPQQAPTSRPVPTPRPVPPPASAPASSPRVSPLEETWEVERPPIPTAPVAPAAPPPSAREPREITMAQALEPSAAMAPAAAPPSGPVAAAAPAATELRARAEMPAVVSDRVQLSVTAPPSVAPGTVFVLDVWTHLAEHRAEVLRRARSALRSKKIYIKEQGPLKIARGTVLGVSLRLEELVVEEPESTILWEGEVGSASFPVRVPADAKRGEKPGRVVVHVDGLELAKLHFTLLVGETSVAPEPLGIGLPAHRTAFASYASADRDAVLHVLQGILKAAPSLEVFLDVASLRSGERWRERLFEEIPRRDVFYLFWSEPASRSEWVEREWRCALETRGIGFIDPVPLVSPEVVPPPKELADELHFGEWLLAYRRQAGAR